MLRANKVAPVNVVHVYRTQNSLLPFRSDTDDLGMEVKETLYR